MTTPPTTAGSDGVEGPHPGGDLGWRVRSRREALGMDRAELARRSGIAPAYLEFIEECAAEPDAMAVAALAGALGTTRKALRGAEPLARAPEDRG